ncbi:hypothetical protein TNCV_3934031 [Trichonephila clavipes]|nr:hypothetical protein TNCV_3934031 [Trichonephila clavipes]
MSQRLIHRYQTSDVRPAHECLSLSFTEQNVCSYRPLRYLPLTPPRCRARLQCISARSGWNHADWGCILLSDESHFQLCPYDHRRRVWIRPAQRADPVYATQALNWELLSGVPFRLTAGPL